MSLRTLGGVVAVLTAMIACAGALAEEYPGTAVRMIVPFPPGGGTDLMARITTTKLGQIFGQQFVVDNRPGAGTVIGTEVAAPAPGDGYTILMQVNSLAANHTRGRADRHRDGGALPGS